MSWFVGVPEPLFDSASTRSSWSISKHSAIRALMLPWPSGMSLPTMNLPSTRMLSIELSWELLETKANGGNPYLHAVWVYFSQ